MSLPKPAGWKFAPITVLAMVITVSGAFAFQPGNAGDTVADNFLGQPDFFHNTANTPDATSLSTQSNLARVAIDKNVTPNRVYVADANNNRVLGYSSITALANGSPANIVIGQPDFFSTGCNTFGKTAQSLCTPQGVAVDSSGNLYVADSNGNNRVLEYNKPFSQGITAGFKANVVLGQGGSFSSNACNNGGGPSDGNMCDPEGIAIDSSNHLWVSDRNNSRILEFDTPLTNDVANFVLGQPNFTSGACNQGTSPSATTLCNADDVAVDTNGNVYVADANNNRVLEYNAALASNNHTANHVWGQGGNLTASACNNGGLNSASLCGPTGVGLDGANNLYIADDSNNRILEYNETANPPTNTTANHVFGQAGSFTTNGCNQGGLGAASVCNPQDVALTNATPNVLAATDMSNNRVLIYDTPLTSQTANVVIGQQDFVHNAANTVDAEGMNGAHGIAVDALNHLYVVDNANGRVLAFTSAATFTNDSQAALVIGQPDFFSAGCNVGGLTASSLCTPAAVATDSSNNLYVSDLGNNRVLKYTAPFTQGKTEGFSAVAVYGQGGSFTSNACNNGGITATSLCAPDGLAVDLHNNLYVADRSNNRVLEFASGPTTASKVFGQGSTGTSFSTGGCNTNGESSTTLCNPFGVATDGNNNVYIADHDNSRALEYNETANPPNNFTANIVFGQAGIFTTNGCNQGGLSANSLCNPHKLTLDSHSNLYISDAGNNRVLEYNTPLTSGTTAAMVFGHSDVFNANQCNNNAGPSQGTLCGPVGVALDAAQDLLVGDFTNNRVLKYLQPLAVTGPVTLAPSPLGFGNIAKGNTSITRTVTATNTGPVPVLFTGISITGTNAADFKVVSNTCTGYVASTKTCKVGMSFTPSAATGTAESATVTLFDNGSNANQTDSLTGTSALKPRSRRASALAMCRTALPVRQRPVRSTTTRACQSA